MNQLTRLPLDVEKMVDGLMGHVWPGGCKLPPVIDELDREPKGPDFAWRDGKAQPVERDQ